MRTKHFFAGTALALALALTAVGCARPPVDEMNEAVEAVIRAENDADAVAFAAGTLSRARDALRMMRDAADSRNFDAARAYAAEAVATADRAIAEGRAGAERAREEAQELIAGLPPLVAETGQGMEIARGAGLDLDFESLDRAFDGAVGRVGMAEDAYSRGLYGDAISQGRTARNGLADINQRIAGAAVAVPSKK